MFHAFFCLTSLYLHTAQSVQWEQSIVLGQYCRICALAIIRRFVTFTVAFIVIFMAWQFNVVGQSPNWLFSLWTIAQATVVAHGVKPWQVLSNISRNHILKTPVVSQKAGSRF